VCPFGTEIKAKKMKNISINLTHRSITGLTENMTPVTQVTMNGEEYYDMITFERIYKVNYSTIDRCIAKDAKGLIKVNGKKYVNEIVLHQTKKGLQFWQAISDKDTTVDGFAVSIESAAQMFAVTGVTLDTGVQYYEMNQFVKQFKICYSKVYKILQSLGSKDRYLFCLSIGGKLYVSPYVLIYLKKHLHHLRNLDYAWLSNRYTWDVVGTIRLEQYMSPKACRELMQKLFHKLCKKYPNIPNYMFFVTEENPDKSGFHNHLVYGNHLHPEYKEIEKLVNRALDPDKGNIERRSLFEKINQQDFFIEYMVKQIHRMPDHYDWLHKNIAQ
jgi:hypothetical protein